MDQRATSTRSETPEAIAHGGDLDAISRRYPDAPHPWIDLSTGINPVPYPPPELAPTSWARLPSKSEERALLAAAAARYGVPDRETIVAAPGTQALLQVLPRLRPRSRVAVLAPTYEEHALCWRRGGHRVELADDLNALAGADVAVIVNPNNPTGRLQPRDALVRLASTLRRRDGLMIVDEAFVDLYPPEASLAADLPPATIVLRSFGKVYGLAGIRLGFAISSDDMIRQIRDELGPWAVSGPALAAGTAALADEAWLHQTRARLAKDCVRIDALLSQAGCMAIGGTPLFRLVASAKASNIAERLARHAIHVRRFPAQPSWLRFGLPGDEAQWQRLAEALAG
ncbi:Putative threonine-phosphate decarboxylase [Bradyrhizobium sp. ORS 285]|uniref:threonine-phosphate decarboxylase CobD n=1 Tax=Bradyrhizobium sp. ORS 285 TaxID=115808 RepID=UPI000240AB6B|nr:threonine-phosphate decarboxylase CobD [Bradyrhizobium sp. ORS 285]CCD85309.1 putative threonine-phosphate decarboxylase [Bradyrhizobium sp. ORS 285]SMX57440.1 Putative threonine-phosphate decarboxylase [Bradyrhizobium sp. ORS 285]